jgi:DNA-binding CsgD family transcriptional regulator/PAS domain-containing protein
MVRTEYYSDYGKSFGLTRCLIGCLEMQSTTRFAVVSVNRPDRASEFGSDEAGLMQILIPHLQRALILHRRLTSLEAERAAAADVIDRLPIGVILVDGDLKVTLVNRVANQLIGQQDGLTVHARVLRATSPTLTARLHGVLTAAVAVTVGESLAVDNAALALPRPSGRRAFQVLVVPVTRRHEIAGWVDGSAAIMFISDPEIRPRPDAEVLGEYFGLTPAEARFAVAVAGGQSPQDVADTQRLTRSTARWLTEQLRRKTASRTQAQAVAAILQSLAVLHPESG